MAIVAVVASYCTMIADYWFATTGVAVIVAVTTAYSRASEWPKLVEIMAKLNGIKLEQVAQIRLKRELQV